ncbi:hypothetical protein MN116_005866 [Schistosoma mekongi]|uniref:Tripartite motif-containing protein 2 n=1 Tax=Schistosoma mekongi TaxID=38744 RepID=A0AAE1ZAG6_SCHME|nr:hypothetical protein MN116_005866 [Schistosoma mekongi]
MDNLQRDDSVLASSVTGEDVEACITINGMIEKTQTDDCNEVNDMLHLAEDVIKCLSERCEELESLSEYLPFVRKEIRGQIDQSMQMIQRSVSERHDYLLNELDSCLSLRNGAINKLHTEFETRLQRLSSHVDLLKRLLHTQPNNEIIYQTHKFIQHTVSRDLAAQKHKAEIEKLISAPVPLHPSESDTMSFFPTDLDQLLSMIRCVGSLGLTAVDAQNTSLSDNYLDQFVPVRRCQANEEVKVDILTNDKLGRTVTNASSKEFSVILTQKCVSEIEVGIQDKNISDSCSSLSLYNNHNGNNNQEHNLQVVYKISHPGLYDLRIKLFGEHIKGSPYCISVDTPPKASLQAISETMKEISELPYRTHHRLQLRRRCQSAPDYSKLSDQPAAFADLHKMERGDFLYSVGTKGRGNGEFANPSGICVTRENKILVADSNNASIQVFTFQGQFISHFGEYGYHPGQLMRPIDVAETINGNYLVSDYELHCVTVYNTSGQYMSRFGQRYLSGPKGMVVDSRGRIVVVDQKSCMICIFKPTGKFINRFGSRGLADNHFGNPVFIAVNSRDEIFVSDYAHHSIKAFDINGLFLYKFGVNGIDPGMLHAPTGIGFDRFDYMYISDWGNNRVQVFDQTGNYVRMIDSKLESLNGPQGLVLHQISNKLFVVDPGNYCFKVFNANSTAEQGRQPTC